jgi:hypothetical protein
MSIVPVLPPRAPVGPDGRRPLSAARAGAIALAAGGLLTLIGLFFVVHGNGWDTFSYWRPPHLGPNLYDGTTTPDGLGQFRYSPAFAQIVSVLWFMPWEAFIGAWFGICFAAYLFVARRWWLVALGFVPVPFELFYGNIHLLIAAAVVASFEWPAAWAFVLLTKVTPGVGALWFAFRREWRSFAIAIGATLAIVAASVAIGGADLWVQWANSLEHSQSASWTVLGWLPLPIRVALAVGLVAYGARRGWRWLVPVAVVLAIPSPWLHSFSILVACVPLGIGATLRAWRQTRVARVPALAAPQIA